MDISENCGIDNLEFAHYHSVVTNKFVKTTSENKAEEQSGESIFEEVFLFVLFCFSFTTVL